jgi:hypothetical protein
VTWNGDVNEFTYEKKDDAKSITMAVTGTLLFVPFIGLILFQLLFSLPVDPLQFGFSYFG